MDITNKLIELALSEDIGTGDITTDNLISPDMNGFGEIVTKEDCIVSGLFIVEEVFNILDPKIEIENKFKDGDFVPNGSVLLKLKGNLQNLLKGERVALNFLQRLSGIATNVRSYVDELKGFDTRLVDTRKTTPGWRVLEKYAVKSGGAYNHRMALYDGVLIKDNHIAVCGGITKAVEKARKNISHFIKIEVEVTNEKELNEAINAGADIIMLDNMNIEEIKKSVKIINKKALVEVSGNVTKENLKGLAKTGVDIISSGALTHQATSVDLSMRLMISE